MRERAEIEPVVALYRAYRQAVLGGDLPRVAIEAGVTGLWQVSGRSNLSWEDTVRLDVYYVDNWSFMQDLAIMLRTARAVVSSRGAY